MRYIYIAFTVAALFALTACSDDDEILASYRYDFADMTTSAQGNAMQLLLDDNSILNVLNTYVTQKPNQTFRVYAVSEQMENGVRLVNYSEILTVEPHMIEEENVKTDPVDVVAVWASGKYINMRLGIKTGASALKHTMGVVNDGITADEGGVKTIHLRLYHAQNNDDVSYTRTTAFSCNISGVKSSLGPDDKIELCINTFSGEKRYYLVD